MSDELLHQQVAVALADSEPGPESTKWLRQADAVLALVSPMLAAEREETRRRLRELVDIEAECGMETARADRAEAMLAAKDAEIERLREYVELDGPAIAVRLVRAEAERDRLLKMFRVTFGVEPTADHFPVGAYLPVGQLDGDCRCGKGSWPCDTLRAEAAGDATDGTVLRREGGA